MFKVGLTGGVASGKSTVSTILGKLGAEIVDADIIAREVVSKDSSCLKEIAIHFGTHILMDDGSLNRKKLAGIVFSDKKKLDLLNSITHPLILQNIKVRLDTLEKEHRLDRVVVDAALLIETGIHVLMDRIWLVKVDKELQISRLMRRDGISAQQAEDIINAQMPVEQKEEYVHVIINNNGSRAELEACVIKLWREISQY